MTRLSPKNLNTDYIHKILGSLASGISQTFGSICEVLVIDLTGQKITITERFNAHQSEYSKDQLVGEQLVQLIKKAEKTGLAPNHFITNIQGRKLKSTIMIMRTPELEPVAALCVNLDITDIEDFSTIIEDVFKIENEASDRSVTHQTARNLSGEPDLHARIRSMLDKIDSHGKQLGRQQKLELVSLLIEDGIFELRGSVKLLAEYLGISKFTVYSYIDEIRRNVARVDKPMTMKWEIPFFLPITGSYAGFGQMIKWTVGEAVKEINSVGGISGRQIVVDYMDTAGDPNRCLSELAGILDSTLVVWGPMAAQTCQATLPLIAEKKAFAMSVACGPEIVRPFRQWTIHFYGEYKKIVPPPMSGWLDRIEQVKRVVQFVWPADPTWMYHAAAQRDVLTQAGAKILEDVECNENTDLKSAVSTALLSNPDAFVISTSPLMAGSIIKELDRQGVKNKSRIMVFKTAESPALYSAAGSSLWGSYHWNVANNTSKNKAWKQFLRKFEAVFKSRPPMFGIPMFYDMVYLTKQAIEKTGITGNTDKLFQERTKIRDYCRSVQNFQGLVHKFSIIDGFAQHPSYLFQFNSDGPQLIDQYLPNASVTHSQVSTTSVEKVR